MQKGFTLIELSIVLVIIGLLIGGILAAQSMVKTAKINAFVRQIQQYDVSVSTFKTKYNGLPGDVHGFSGLAAAYGPDSQDRDGILCEDDCAQNNFGGELNYFWKDLTINDPVVSTNACGVNQFAGLTQPIISGANCSFPPSKLKNDNMIFAAALIESNGLGGWATASSSWKNYYVVAYPRSKTGTFFSEFQLAANIDGADVIAADKKIDNGIKSSGDMVAVSQADLDTYGGQGWGASGEGAGGIPGAMGEFVSSNVRAGTPALCGDFCYANVADYDPTQTYIFAIKMLKDQGN